MVILEKAKLTTELTDRITALSDGMHMTEVKMIETAAICPNPYESPRKFSPAEVRSLAAELRQKGMSSPLLIQNVGTHDAPLYQLICGEKRFRAALMADMLKVPCAVIEKNAIPDETLHDIPLPRNCFEEADVLSDIVQRKRYPKGELAAKLGISPATLENKLCLCSVTPEKRRFLLSAEVSPRHCILFSKQNSDIQNKILTELQNEKARGERAQVIIERFCAETTKNRKFVFHDTLPFFNTVEKAVATMRGAGINIGYERTERQSDVLLSISVPRVSR